MWQCSAPDCCGPRLTSGAVPNYAGDERERAHPVRGKGRAHLEQQLRVRTFFQPDSFGPSRRNHERKVVDGPQAAARPSQHGAVQKQAKELLKAYRSADVETRRRVKRNHPRFEKLAEPGFDIRQFALADAQLVIARE